MSNQLLMWGQKTRQGALLKPPPRIDLASMWLDGSIVESSGSYYFNNKNGEDVLITGYDFSAGWTKGFPYKSAATIDVFGLTGVPVISLFQNFDYGNQYFSRHIAQTVDSNGVELTEAYISEIVAYSVALTGDDLIKAAAYFSVTTEDATAKWVAIDGVDAAAGTKVAPWATTNKATALTANAKAYIKSGAYLNETLGYFYNAADNVIIGVGFVLTDNGGTSYGSRVRYATTKRIYGIVFQCGNNTYNIYSQTAADTIYDKIKVKGQTGGKTIYGSFAVVKNSVLDLRTSAAPIEINEGNNTVRIENCHLNCKSPTEYIIKSFAGGGTIELINNKIIGALVTCAIYVQIVPFMVKGNKFLTNPDKMHVYSVTNKESHIYYNYFSQRNDAVNYLGFLNSVADIIGNTLVNLSEHANSTTSDISCQNDAATAVTGYIIQNNVIKSYRIAGYNIICGKDGTGLGTGMVTSIDVSGNKIIGANTQSVKPASNSTHGIIIGFQNNATVKWNFINGSGYGIIIKGNVDSSFTGGVWGNVIKNTKYPLYSKGVDDVVIVNNTVINTDVSATYGILIGNEPGGHQASNCVVKNNIVINNTATSIIGVMIDGAGANTQVDYNMYYSVGTLVFHEGGNNYTFAQWQALGYDTHSIVLTTEQFNELFTDFSNGDYSLKIDSVAIGLGVALDAAYDDGLDASTNWGTDIQIPVVVTKQQGVSWDAGAYIY